MANKWLLKIISVAVSIGVFCGGLVPGYTVLAANRNNEISMTSSTTIAFSTGSATAPIASDTVTSAGVAAQSQAAPQTKGVQTASQPQGYAKGFRSFSRRSTRRSYGYSGYGYGGSRFGYGGFGSHLFSFGAGYLFGSLFHPFGGYYGYGGMYGYHHFSLLGLFFDLFILYIIWRIIRAFFRRR